MASRHASARSRTGADAPSRSSMRLIADQAALSKERSMLAMSRSGDTLRLRSPPVGRDRPRSR